MWMIVFMAWDCLNPTMRPNNINEMMCIAHVSGGCEGAVSWLKDNDFVHGWAADNALLFNPSRNLVGRVFDDGKQVFHCPKTRVYNPSRNIFRELREAQKGNDDAQNE